VSLNARIFPGTEIIHSQLVLHVENVIQTFIFLARYSQAITDLTTGESFHFLTPFEITFVHFANAPAMTEKKETFKDLKKTPISCSYKVFFKLNDSQMFYILCTSSDNDPY